MTILILASMFAGSMGTMVAVTGLCYLVIRGGGHPDRQLGIVVIISAVLFSLGLITVYVLAGQ